MKYQKIKNNSYNLHLINTNKFKTITIKINFKRKLKKEEVTIRNMLINTLCESTKDYPSKRLLEIETEELYNLAYKATSYISGGYSVMSFDINFLETKYTEESIIRKSLNFINSLIFNPNIKDNQFDESSFKNAKSVLKDAIESLKENTKMYSKIRMLEEMEDSLISIRNVGYIDDLEKINESNLYEYYKSVINEDIIDVFVIGNIDNEVVQEMINDLFTFRKLNNDSESHFITPKNKTTEVKIVKEQQNINQSSLVMGYKIDDMSDFELRYVLTVYSYILGGGADSKLFKTVREKNSLCYSISSNAQALSSILSIWAGINASDYEKAVKLIKEEVKNIELGKFLAEDLDKAKTTYINSINELTDNPNSILNLYVGIEYLKSDDLDTRIESINKVTKEDVIALSKKVHLDTIYLLEGDTNEEK